MSHQETSPTVLISQQLSSAQECRKCELGDRYCAELRARNLRLLKEFAPRTVKKIVLCESPPKSYGYIYDEFTTTRPGRLAYELFHDLGYLEKDVPSALKHSEKRQYLGQMKRKGVLVLDCCQCAVNWPEYSNEEMKNFVRNCFEKNSFASELLQILIERNNSIRIMNAFPRRRKGLGKEILRSLGFEEEKKSQNQGCRRAWWKLKVKAQERAQKRRRL